MKLASARVVDRLVVEAPCLGAAFTSFTFDPVFFEESVLRAVLRLTSDPVEHRARFLDEGRAALLEIPVACIVDASMRRAGRRMPYDLLEVHGRTFHPKVGLLLFESFARVHVGSGNLTEDGYGKNTELFVTFDLPYKDAASVAVLREIDDFFESVVALAGNPGTQLALVRAELHRRIEGKAPGAATAFAVLHSERDTPILTQLLALVPEDARITRVGVMAPFFERDDASTGAELDSVLGQLADARKAKGLVLDVGVAWDDPATVARPDAPTQELNDGLGSLWARLGRSDDGEALVSQFTLDKLTPKQAHVRDALGVSRHESRDELERARSDGKAWAIPTPRIFAPKSLLEAVGRRADVHVWLHPSWRFEEGRQTNRPLHAKLLLVTFVRDGEAQTVALIGSPNASRRALLQLPSHGANIELGIAMLLEGEVSLPDLAPALVWCDPDRIEWAERTFPEAPPNLALCIDSAVHDPKEKTLTVTWVSPAPHVLVAWSLRYAGTTLWSGTGAPATPLVARPFQLLASSCELELVANEATFSIPILVTDLIALPTVADGQPLGLEELLMLLGRKITVERLATVRAQVQAAAERGVLLDSFGGEFAPTDVFKAWWAAARDLEEGRSVQSFRRLLEGPTGLGATWAAMRSTSSPRPVRPEEAWFYGVELVRTLDAVTLPEGTDKEEKRALLASFIRRLRDDLSTIAPADEPWMGAMRKFYGVEA